MPHYRAIAKIQLLNTWKCRKSIEGLILHSTTLQAVPVERFNAANQCCCIGNCNSLYPKMEDSCKLSNPEAEIDNQSPCLLVSTIVHQPHCQSQFLVAGTFSLSSIFGSKHLNSLY